ncbi:MAG TPA: hypothetical protein VHP83_03375 [Aggregatilineaceae bacterium]|nr:hypothetical protein [Aggregatilineaceae bacterium]
MSKNLADTAATAATATGAGTSVILTCPDQLRWVHDAQWIWIVDPRTGTTHCLDGIEAAVWGWMMLGYSYPRLVALLGPLLNLERLEAQQHLNTLLQTWISAGLLERKA